MLRVAVNVNPEGVFAVESLVGTLGVPDIDGTPLDLTSVAPKVNVPVDDVTNRLKLKPVEGVTFFDASPAPKLKLKPPVELMVSGLLDDMDEDTIVSCLNPGFGVS